MELVQSLLIRFAAEYDCGAYGASTYGNGDPCAGLAATGESYIALAILGAVMVALAIGILIFRRRKMSNR